MASEQDSMIDEKLLNRLNSATEKWTLDSDSKLLSLLQTFSEKFHDSSSKTLEKVSNLNLEASEMNISLHNTLNDFCLLKNSKFVENRVYDDDEAFEKTEELAVKKAHPQHIEYLTKALTCGEQALNSWDENNVSEDDLYNNRALPYIIGSKEFYCCDLAGLGDDVRNIRSRSISPTRSRSISQTRSDHSSIPIIEREEMEKMRSRSISALRDNQFQLPSAETDPQERSTENEYQPQNGSPAFSTEDWNCQMCTLINQADDLECAACGSLRDLDSFPLHIPKAKQNDQERYDAAEPQMGVVSEEIAENTNYEGSMIETHEKNYLIGESPKDTAQDQIPSESNNLVEAQDAMIDPSDLDFRTLQQRIASELSGRGEPRISVDYGNSVDSKSRKKSESQVSADYGKRSRLSSGKTNPQPVLEVAPNTTEHFEDPHGLFGQHDEDGLFGDGTTFNEDQNAEEARKKTALSLGLLFGGESSGGSLFGDIDEPKLRQEKTTRSRKSKATSNGSLFTDTSEPLAQKNFHKTPQGKTTALFGEENAIPSNVPEKDKLSSGIFNDDPLGQPMVSTLPFKETSTLQSNIVEHKNSSNATQSIFEDERPLGAPTADLQTKVTHSVSEKSKDLTSTLFEDDLFGAANGSSALFGSEPFAVQNDPSTKDKSKGLFDDFSDDEDSIFPRFPNALKKSIEDHDLISETEAAQKQLKDSGNVSENIPSVVDDSSKKSISSQAEEISGEPLVSQISSRKPVGNGNAVLGAEYKAVNEVDHQNQSSHPAKSHDPLSDGMIHTESNTLQPQLNALTAPLEDSTAQEQVLSSNSEDLVTAAIKRRTLFEDPDSDESDISDWDEESSTKDPLPLQSGSEVVSVDQTAFVASADAESFSKSLGKQGDDLILEKKHLPADSEKHEETKKPLKPESVPVESSLLKSLDGAAPLPSNDLQAAALKRRTLFGDNESEDESENSDWSEEDGPVDNPPIQSDGMSSGVGQTPASAPQEKITAAVGTNFTDGEDEEFGKSEKKSNEIHRVPQTNPLMDSGPEEPEFVSDKDSASTSTKGDPNATLINEETGKESKSNVSVVEGEDPFSSDLFAVDTSDFDEAPLSFSSGAHLEHKSETTSVQKVAPKISQLQGALQLDPTQSLMNFSSKSAAEPQDQKSEMDNSAILSRPIIAGRNRRPRTRKSSVASNGTLKTLIDTQETKHQTLAPQKSEAEQSLEAHQNLLFESQHVSMVESSLFDDPPIPPVPTSNPNPNRLILQESPKAAKLRPSLFGDDESNLFSDLGRKDQEKINKHSSLFGDDLFS